MDNFIIKCGKAWHVLQRDGFYRGSHRIFSAFSAMFRKVQPGDVLFISGGVGDSALYRTVHVAEELTLKGFKCSVTVQDNPQILKYANQFSVFIFHRTLYTKNIARMIMLLKKQKRTIIFDTDDLVFDPQYLKYMDYYKKMNKLEQKLYENGVGGEILSDNYVKIATTTTSFLAEKLREKGKDVFVVANKLSQNDVKGAKKICAQKKTYKNNNKIIKIGYFSGTISHNKDFATITDALMTVMKKWKNIELFLVGPLDVDNELVQRFGDRITQLPYSKRMKHFANIARCDINLAPLEQDNPFCDAKSELKFFEAGIVKVPTVAVANDTFTRAIHDGIDGFLAADTQEWVEKITKLIVDENLREKIGIAAYQTTIAHYTTQNAHNTPYYNCLHQEIRKNVSH